MEVPITVPLRMPSTEERRRHEADITSNNLDDDDSMDIAHMVASAPNIRDTNPDLLGFSPPKKHLPSATRFERTPRPASIAEYRDGADDDFSPGGFRTGSPSIRPDLKFSANGPYNQGRVSYDSGMTAARDRGRISRTALNRRNSHTSGFPVYQDEEGDLGYSAVDAGEGARRKVIAERLETVKTRNPVFTWC